MKLITVATTLCLAVSAFTAETDTLWYDTIYDQESNPLSDVACSNGVNGLESYGYTTFRGVPTYPFIGGAAQIQSWNSDYCGSCWLITYTDPRGVTTSVSFIAINTAPRGFTTSYTAMDILTNGDAQSLDGVLITVAQQDKTACNMF